MSLTNKAEYLEAELNFSNWIRRTKGPEAEERASNAKAFAKIEALKQLAIAGKLEQCQEWIQDFIEADGKLVVFATHIKTLDYLQSKFKLLCYG